MPASSLYKHLIVFGATGDLSRRYLLPAAARLLQEGFLPPDIQICGVARNESSTDTFRSAVAEALDESSDLDSSTKQAFLKSLTFQRADVTSEDETREVLGHLDNPVVAYLALPPSTFSSAIDVLAKAMPVGSRVAIEKPFGENLSMARDLNEQLRRTFPGDAVYRVDHFLGLAAARALPGLRFANPPFERAWSRDAIERVDITWDEQLALEGRAGYYDATGALRDMIQNHLLQVLAAVAQEPHNEVDGDQYRQSRLDLLRSVRVAPGDISRRVIRARYEAGKANGETIPAYANEEGVDPARETETFVAVVLHVDNDRWRDVPFVLRTGKALASDRQQIDIQFRRGSLANLPGYEVREGTPRLTVGLLPANLHLATTVTTSRKASAPLPVVLTGEIPEILPPYAEVLQEILEGGASLSVRDDEAEELWRIVEPIMESWASGGSPLLEYRAGSDGPSLDGLDLTPDTH